MKRRAKASLEEREPPRERYTRMARHSAQFWGGGSEVGGLFLEEGFWEAVGRVCAAGNGGRDNLDGLVLVARRC